MVRVGDDFTSEYPDADAASTELFATLMRTGFVLRAELDRVVSASLGINQAMTNTLAVIEGADEPLTPSEISDRTLISSATMTSTLDRLERQGWIRRLPNPEDRRSVLVEVTEEGQALCDRFLPGIHAVERRSCPTWTPPSATQLLRAARQDARRRRPGDGRRADAPRGHAGSGVPTGNDADPPGQYGRVDVRRAGSGLVGVLVGLLGRSLLGSLVRRPPRRLGDGLVARSPRREPPRWSPRPRPRRPRSPRATPPRRSSVGASVSSVSSAAGAGVAFLAGSAFFLLRAGFGSYFSVTSSITAMGALSPLRGAILVIRV